MKKISIAVVAAFALIAVPAGATAAEAPKPGAACEMKGAVVTAKSRTFVCQPSGTWTKGLKKSKLALTTKDMWVKAADSGMTAAFGMVTNPTAKDIRVIGATSPQYSSMLQLHEVVMNSDSNSMVMQQKDAGFVIPAGETVMLKPGGDHIMFMGVKKPITAGATIPITLIGSNGEQLKFRALAKVYSGANENYEHSGM